MSIKVMSWVWENVNLKASHKLVLLALSDNANDEGVCWPSIMTIAQKCGLSDRYTKDILSDLRHDGYLNVEYRKDGEKNQTNLYTVMWGGIPPQGGEAERPTGGEADLPRVGRQASPKSSINHNIEPSINGNNTPVTEHPSITIFRDSTDNRKKAVINKAQRQSLVDLYTTYGEQAYRDKVNWTAINNMPIGRSITSMTTALKKHPHPKGESPLDRMIRQEKEAELAKAD